MDSLSESDREVGGGVGWGGVNGATGHLYKPRKNIQEIFLTFQYI